MRDVQVVGGAGDGGADVVATDGRGDRWVFQSKFHGTGGAGAEGPREAVRALSRYSAQVAVAATNSWFRPEAYAFAKAAKSNGIDLRLWNGTTLLHYFTQLPERSRGYRQLRDYQAAAVAAVEASRQQGNSSSLVIMATGLGKSMVAGELIRSELERNPDQEVLLLAQTIDLVRQLEVSLWPQIDKRHSTHLWTDGERPTYPGGVVVATWQSVEAALRNGDPISGRFGLVIVDEAHHAPSNSYRRLLEVLSPNYLVGLTATPWRGDEQSLTGIFGQPAFTMDIIDGMQKGYLAEVDYELLTDGIDWDEVARQSRLGLTVRELNTLLLLPERDAAMAETIGERLAEIPNPRAIGFCRTIDHAERLQPLLAAMGVRTAVLHSKLPRDQRFTTLSAFRRGELEMLLAVEMLNEGIDVPDVNLVAFMRVTHSRRIFVQQLGRGLRLNPGKSKVVVLDFVADVRRIAAAGALNREARRRAEGTEVFRYADGRIIKFSDSGSGTFFEKYLADIADVEGLDDGARLKFPDPTST
jgi:superfamily II DNA or RNA helicase